MKLTIGGVLIAVLIALANVRSASACGASVGGVNGATSCSLAEHEEEMRLKFRIGASASYTWTAIKYSGGLRASQERFASLATFEYRPIAKISIVLGVGPFLYGRMELDGFRYNFDPGVRWSGRGHMARP